MTISTRRVRNRALVAAICAGLALTACAPGASDEGETADEKIVVSTDISGVGDVTLSVWDQEVRGGQDEQMKQLNKAFMDKYPNITIKRNSQSFEDLGKTLRLALTSGDDAPDVVEANNARAQMGQFVNAKQILPLDPWAEAYGWKDRYPESILQYSTYTEDAKTFGEGNLYGLPQVGEVVGVFYNTEKLAELGLQIPATWADFEASFATAKNAGVTPIQLGNLEKWPAIHVFGPIQGANTPAEEIVDLGLGNPGGDWNNATNVAAAQTLADWVEKGYFNNAPNGTDYDPAWQAFSKGESLYLIAGSWLAADLDPVMGAKVGFFAPPPVTAGDAPATTGGTGLPFAITKASKNPNVAAAYIDFITSEDAMKILAETGNVPVVNTAELAPASGVVRDVAVAFEEVTTKGKLLPYLDYATPTFSDTLGSALQDLIAAQSTPEEFVKVLQKDYEEFTKK